MHMHTYTYTQILIHILTEVAIGKLSGKMMF